MNVLPRGKWPALNGRSVALRGNPVTQEAQVQPVADLGAHEETLHAPCGGFGFADEGAGRRRKPVGVRSWICSSLDNEVEPSHERDVVLLECET